jgi:tryptophan halogenase
VAETCGLDEKVWMRDAKATFKYGIEFLDFQKMGSRWFHTFDDLLPGQVFHTPITEFGKNIFKKQISSVEYFLTKRAQQTPGYNIQWYNDSQGGCEFLLANKLSPYDVQGQCNFNKFPGYSYHINAQEFGNSLRKHTPKHKYTEIRGHVVDVNQDHTGIKSLIFKDGTNISADLFIDCTGFRRVLIGSMTEFKPYTGLLNNAAIWGPVKKQVYRPSTLSIAQPHGWIWETPTWGQIGSGYVFCDDFITVEQAEEHIRQHWARQGHKWEPLRSVKFTSGRLDKIAVKNVIANGLGQSFIEPLEATAIMIACVTIRNVAKLFNKHQQWSEQSSKILSTVIERFLRENKEFVLGHYALTDRADTDYWRSYHSPDTLEYVAHMIEKKLQSEWVSHGETNYNGYNWTSMLIGYDKPYLGKLPKIEAWQMENYEFYTKYLVQNYQHIYKNNMSIKDRLHLIHQ